MCRAVSCLQYNGYLPDTCEFWCTADGVTMRTRETAMHCDECGTELYEAGEVVPAGDYTRVDDRSFRHVALIQRGPLPPSFDGHIALYRSAAAPCACEGRHTTTNAFASARAARKS